MKDPQSLWIAANGATYRQYRTMFDHNQAARLAAYAPVRLNVSVKGSLEPTAEGLLVSGTYFPLLGVNPVAGRTFGVEDDRFPNGHPVAMISYGYWKRRFALDPGITGATISLSGTPFTIIGVTPREFFGVEAGAAPDIFVPVMMQPAVMPSVENLLENPIIYSTWLRTLARLNPGVSVPHAADALTVLYRQEIPQGPKSTGLDKGKIVLLPAATGLSDLRRQFSQSLYILMAVVGVVLLIACANTANLLLARAAARGPEFAMRLALGAGRSRLVIQLLVESVVLAVAGGACGILLARWAAKLLVAFLSSGRAPIALDLNPDLRVLAFTAGVSIVSGILFGLAPALRAARIDLTPSLKHLSGSLSLARGGLRPGQMLAVSQVALSLVLLAGAGLFVRSLRKLNNQDDGVPRESVLVVRVEPKGSDQGNIPGASQRLDRIYKDLLQRVETVPGVRSASLAQFTPTDRAGVPRPMELPSGERKQVSVNMLYPKYFATMGVEVMAGRDFEERDLGESSPPVTVVNEAFARQIYPGENPVGKPCLIRNRARLSCEIVGVVKDSRYANLRGETPAAVYQPFLQTQTGRGQMALHVRCKFRRNSSAHPGGSPKGR